MTSRLLFLIGFVTVTQVTRAIEPWADDKLPVKNGVALWLDASRLAKDRSRLDVWRDGSGMKRDAVQAEAGRQPALDLAPVGQSVKFDGVDDFFASPGPEKAGSVTLFIVAAPERNRGNYSALASFTAPGANDYRAGLNVDMGFGATPALEVINIEGAGVTGGAINLLKSRFDFGAFHVFSVLADRTNQQLRVDGKAEASRPRNEVSLAMAQAFIGARNYSNTGTPPAPSGFFAGNIAEVLLYDRALGDEDQKQVELYLMEKHAGLRAMKPRTGTKPLKPATNLPPVQFLAPGFEVREAPLKLAGDQSPKAVKLEPGLAPFQKQEPDGGFPNINFLRYRHDGVLVAGGYNGKVYLLRDTDGDGIEDAASVYWESEKIRVVMGMAVTPKGDARGDGVFVATLGRVLFIPDKNGDGKGDEEVVVADGWAPPQVFAGGASDCLGLALDREGNVWFGLGTKNMFKAYVPDATGKATYTVEDERGSIFRVSADFKTRTKICSGIRYPVGFGFNAAGDLFVTDQEGATWLSNGNPYDEFLHIQPGRHYGFPPRHPQHLPQVNDEPSVFDFEPQHQSTCGFFFNERSDGGRIFGRDWWKGDAFICGESRGKLYRLKLANTPAGYVAQSQLMASIAMLPIDAVLSPRGDLVVTCHSGAPDWGSGPNGSGKIFHVRPSEAPLPVLAWASAPGEWRIAFDRPLKPEKLRDLTKRTDITAGRYVYAADRYEMLRPGYQVVKDQLIEPRFDVPVLGSSISADGRTLMLRTEPRLMAENIAITVPTDTGESVPVDVQTSLHGIAATWKGADSRQWNGWLPHPDTSVARTFTQASSEHDMLWPMTTTSGTLTLKGQLDLWHMLRPAVQAGTKLDYEYAPETVSLVFTANAAFQLSAGERPVSSVAKDGRHTATVTVESKNEGAWLAYELAIQTANPAVSLHWFTQEESRPRTMPLRRLLLPWAKFSKADATVAGNNRDIPELRGGDWARGKAVFNGKAACATCHTTSETTGVPKLGANLANLVHRDYESVLRDIREPSAAINPEHIGQNVETTDGDSFTAVLSGEKDGVLTFVEATGQRLVPRAKVKTMAALPLSLMPQGLWEALTDGEQRDLMTFLLTPPPAEPSVSRDPHLIEAVILTGLDGPFHQWEQTSVALKQELERDPRFHVRIVTDPEWLATEALFKTDVLIQHYVNYNTGGLSDRARANLLKYVNDGGGLAVMHFANGAFNPLTTGPAASDWPDYRRLLLQRAWVGKDGSTHDNYGAFRVQPAANRHAITTGFAPFDTIDELYCRQVPTGDSPEALPLITAACKTTGKEEPLAWAFQRGKGRVFQSLLGHSHVSMHAAGEFHRRGIAWAGGREPVAAPLEPAPLKLPGAPAQRKLGEVKAILGTALTAKPNPNAQPLRIVLCASDKDAAHGAPGMHDYPLWRSRWSRLLGMADGVSVETANNWPGEEQWNAADVVVFNSYNPAWANEPNNSAIQKRGEDMDKFLARGGGIVFVHYALNAGKNASQLATRLGATWAIPPAKFRHGATDWVLDKKHPLAAGFDKFQIPDESYWRLTGDLAAAQASVLATSVEDGAPTPQMWTREVGPGRVFVSVPGHFTWTHDDPLYRILIFRGMMWTAKQPLDRLAPLSIIGARVEP